MNNAPSFVHHFKGHRSIVSELSFSPDGKQLASSSHDSSVMLWNLATMRNSIKFMAHQIPMTHVHFSPTGDLMASSQGSYVRLWVPLIKGTWHECKVHSTTVRSVRFHPNGKTFVTASNDKTIKLWDTSSRKFILSLTGHTNWVRSARYSCDGTSIISCSDDKTVKLWDPKSGKNVHTYSNNKGIANYVDCHPIGHYIGAGMSYGTIKIFDCRQHELLQYYSCHEGQVNSIVFDPNGIFMVSGGDDGTMKIIDLIEGRVLYTIEIGEPVNSVCFSSCGQKFASASKDKQIRLWKTQMKSVQHHASHHLRQSTIENCQDNELITLETDKEEQPPGIQDVYSPEDYQETELQAKVSPEVNETSDNTEYQENCTPVDAYIGPTSPHPNEIETLRAVNKELLLKNEELLAENAALKEKMKRLEIIVGVPLESV